MLKGSVTVRATDKWALTFVGEGYGARPRQDWAADSGLADGAPFGLLHGTVYGRDLGPGNRVSIQATVRNMLDTDYDTAVYRDEVNRVSGPADAPEPRYPEQHGGERRSVHVGVEVGF